MGRKTEAPRQTEQLDQSLNTSTHHAVRVTQRKCTLRRSVPGSNAFVPSVAGLIIGGEVVKDFVGFVPMKG